jgi:hypothetical protein
MLPSVDMSARKAPGGAVLYRVSKAKPIGRAGIAFGLPDDGGMDIMVFLLRVLWGSEAPSEGTGIVGLCCGEVCLR